LLTLLPAGTSKPVPRRSDAAARRATVSDPDVALLSSPKSRSETQTLVLSNLSSLRADADQTAAPRRLQKTGVSTR
jgi:hypothetical protein